ncbi:LysR family transcriptional regulator [Pantoea phytobeneficialis]|uniref:LysR family transcriptional regulator n=1 Tax=Pantoea phytobeneficialis TaxID=2052056 RepID=A0AAP9KRF8_9GAMM|nr:LysR family transcriptional regulator [Pantoea phytobeneficialis]MDO6408747.1 LysR family transcriptional regulator [Pantoea phytobeneficialis]QGR08995.1 LysR family transcriptional regulator [Pantoea phytobeneficialis]
MNEPDLNLLLALDALLAEGSVIGAARRLGLSESAMSRTLGRLRITTGDALLVRAGRKMVLTPYAEAIRQRTQQSLAEARALLQPAETVLDLARLERQFVLRTNEGFVEAFGGILIGAVAQLAPGVRLDFVAKPEKSSRDLREGRIDLDIGVLGNMGPEIRMQALFRDRFIGVVRQGHPLTQQVTLSQLAAFGHIVASRRGELGGPVHDALVAAGYTRQIAAVVPAFSSAVAIAQHSDLVALVPRSLFLHHPLIKNNPMLASFALPFSTPEMTVAQFWHPRLDNDAAHRWLRGRVHDLISACGNT